MRRYLQIMCRFTSTVSERIKQSLSITSFSKRTAYTPLFIGKPLLCRVLHYFSSLCVKKKENVTFPAVLFVVCSQSVSGMANLKGRQLSKLFFPLSIKSYWKERICWWGKMFPFRLGSISITSHRLRQSGTFWPSPNVFDFVIHRLIAMVISHLSVDSCSGL